jgi:ribosomal protein L30E
MPKKKKKVRMVSGIDKQIKDAMKDGKIIIGSNSVLRQLKKGRVGAVIYAENAPESRVRDLDHYSSVSGAEIMKYSGKSSKLGETCGKPFNILLIGIMK